MWPKDGLVRLRVGEHRLGRRVCGCGRVTVAASSAGVGAPTLYGDRIKATALYLMQAQHVPIGRIATLFREVFDASVSPGFLAGLVESAAGQTTPFLHQVRQQLGAAPVAHFDETGLAKPGAAMLDVGSGVAGLAVGFAQAFPALTVVGIDVMPRVLAFGARPPQERCPERVILRHQDVTELDEAESFDLAWVPAPFLPSRRSPPGSRGSTRRCDLAVPTWTTGRPSGFWRLLASAPSRHFRPRPAPQPSRSPESPELTRRGRTARRDPRCRYEPWLREIGRR